MVVGVDAQRVDRLDARRRLDRFDLGVEVVARHERLDDCLDLLGLDPLEDRRAAALPALDAVDVRFVAASGSRVSRPDVVGDERHMVAS